ncbi:hypothetical protein Tco_1513220, partial [Tanacetum coccineum]
ISRSLMEDMLPLVEESEEERSLVQDKQINQAWMKGHVISKVVYKESKTSRHVKKGQDTKIPQSSGPLVKVGDEAVHKELGERIERAATTAYS